MSDRLDTFTRSNRTLVAWLLVAVTGLGLVALGNGGLLSSGGSSAARTSVKAAAATRPAAEQRSTITESDRTPIRVLIQRRVHADDACAPTGRVPIAVMIACHRGDLVEGDLP